MQLGIPPAGRLRGLGVPQTAQAVEGSLLAAELLVFLLLVGLAFGNAGPLTAPVRQTLTLVAGASWLAGTAGRQGTPRPRSRAFLGTAIALLGLYVAAATHIQWAQALGLAALLAGAGVLAADARRHAVVYLCAVALAVSSLWALWCASSSDSFYVMRGVAGCVGAVVNRIWLRQGGLSWTACGLGTALPAAAVLLAGSAVTRGRWSAGASVALAGLFVAPLLAYPGLIELSDGWLPLAVNRFRLAPDTSQALLLVLLAPAAALVCHRLVNSGWTPPPVRLAWGPLALFALGGLVMALPPDERVHSGDVVIWGHGLVDWKVPTHDEYGARTGGMFGLLPEYLRAMGIDARVLHDERLAPDDLAKVAAFVVINLMQPFSDRELATIEGFVGRGGRLVVFGDHTDASGIRSPTNELLAPYGMSLRFDSALPRRFDWSGCLDLALHPICTGLQQSSDVGIKVGASLNVARPSRPLIVGRCAFSDLGNKLNTARALLGDYAHSDWEPLGDVVLAASTPYRRGHVLAFGDTSMLQNAKLAACHRFVRAIFGWARARDNRRIGRDNAGLGGLLLALGAVALLWRRAPAVWSLVAVAAVASALGQVGAAARDLAPTPHTGAAVRGRALVDGAHCNLLSYEPTEPMAFWSLTHNLYRSGYLPFVSSPVAPAAPNLAGARVLAIIAPGRPYSAREAERVLDWVRRGGVLLLSVGWEEAGNCAELLSRIGLSIRPVPLGRVRGASPWVKPHLQFAEAWPIEAPSDAEVLARAYGEPVVVQRRLGQGTAVLYADSWALLNTSLESTDASRRDNTEVGNLLLLRHILGGAHAKRAPH